MRSLAALLVVLVALLSPWKLLADSKSTLSVEVKNQYEKPVDNATVILDFHSTRQVSRFGFKKPIHWEVHTNQQGKAHFPPVPYGKVQVQVITSKYQTFGKNVELDADDKKLEVQLQPPQSQYSAHPALKPADPAPPKN